MSNTFGMRYKDGKLFVNDHLVTEDKARSADERAMIIVKDKSSILCCECSFLDTPRSLDMRLWIPLLKTIEPWKMMTEGVRTYVSPQRLEEERAGAIEDEEGLLVWEGS